MESNVCNANYILCGENRVTLTYEGRISFFVLRLFNLSHKFLQKLQ